MVKPQANTSIEETKEASLSNQQLDRKVRGGSYRVLGEWEPTKPHRKPRSISYGNEMGLRQQPEEDEDGSESKQQELGEEEERDPMDWADLKEFGGKLTRQEWLEQRRLRAQLRGRKYSHDEVKQQLEELKEIESRMAEGAEEKKSKKPMMDTISWLKKHSSEASESMDKQKAKRKSNFVHSVMGLFKGKSSEREQPSGNNQEEQEDNQTSELETELTSPWGQENLECEWSRVGFALLNQPIFDDMARVRHVVESKELEGAPAQDLMLLAKWLRLFDKHVKHTATLKEYLLEERAVLAGVGYKVTTLYESYEQALENVLKKAHDTPKEFGESLATMLDELQAILLDEEMAVQEVLNQTLDESREYYAVSSLFHNLGVEEETGVVVAKVFGWVQKNLPQEDSEQFEALFDEEIKGKVTGEWMKHFASYLQLLEHFPVDYGDSLTYFT